MGWYYYLDERLPTPFRARCIAPRATSPLREGEEVTVTGMAPEDDCMHEMFVIIQWQHRTLGLTFKENVPDLRNSRVPDIINELAEFGIVPLVHDPLADPREAMEEYGVTQCAWEDLRNQDALVLAVPHRAYRATPQVELLGTLNNHGVVIDSKGICERASLPASVHYYSL